MQTVDQRQQAENKRIIPTSVLSVSQESERRYLRRCLVGLWVRAALVRGDGVDGGQNDGVLLLHHVSILEGVFLRPLCRSEVAVALLRTPEQSRVREAAESMSKKMESDRNTMKGS